MKTEFPATRKYAVFISYRHADNKEMGRKWANWLHEALESYEVPPDLIGTTNQRGDKVAASLYPVFRDEEELPADADLSTNIRRALENSGLLVVLCSPRAVQSRFVADEIRFFKEQGKSDRILALMIDGEPNASDDPAKRETFGPEAECFPEPLRFGVATEDNPKHIDWTSRTEPIAADVRPNGQCEQGWTTAAAYEEQLEKAGKLDRRQLNAAVRDYTERLELSKLKIIAGAVGLPLGVLSKRDKVLQLAKARLRTQVLRNWLAAVGALTLASVVAGVVAWHQKQEAERALKVSAELELASRISAADGMIRRGMNYLEENSDDLGLACFAGAAHIAPDLVEPYVALHSVITSKEVLAVPVGVGDYHLASRKIAWQASGTGIDRTAQGDLVIKKVQDKLSARYWSDEGPTKYSRWRNDVELERPWLDKIKSAKGYSEDITAAMLAVDSGSALICGGRQRGSDLILSPGYYEILTKAEDGALTGYGGKSDVKYSGYWCDMSPSGEKVLVLGADSKGSIAEIILVSMDDNSESERQRIIIARNTEPAFGFFMTDSTVLLGWENGLDAFRFGIWQIQRVKVMPGKHSGLASRRSLGWLDTGESGPIQVGNSTLKIGNKAGVLTVRDAESGTVKGDPFWSGTMSDQWTAFETSPNSGLLVLATHRETVGGTMRMFYQIWSARSSMALSRRRSAFSRLRDDGPDLEFDGHWLFGSEEYKDPPEWQRLLIPRSSNSSIMALAEIVAGAKPNKHGQMVTTPLPDVIEAFNALKLSELSLITEN